MADIFLVKYRVECHCSVSQILLTCKPPYLQILQALQLYLVLFSLLRFGKEWWRLKNIWKLVKPRRGRRERSKLFYSSSLNHLFHSQDTKQGISDCQSIAWKKKFSRRCIKLDMIMSSSGQTLFISGPLHNKMFISQSTIINYHIYFIAL